MLPLHFRSFIPEREYPKFIVDDPVEPLAPYSDVDEKEESPKQSVEYLPFWRQFPPKKGEML